MNRPPYPSLTAVVHGMVKAAPSGLDARTVADLVGKPYATLMSELSQQPGHKLGAELLLPLMDVCESDLPLVFLARQRGGAFVPLRLSMTHRALLAFLQQAGQRRAAAVA